MAFSAVPTGWLSDFASDSTYMKLPYTNFVETTSTEANASTGDIRKMYFGICQGMFNSYNNKAAADRPTRMIISKAVSVDTISGISTVQYTFTFKTQTLTQEVEAE